MDRSIDMTVNDDHHKVVITKVFPIDRETLFSAFTESQKLKKWFCIEQGWDAEVKNTLRVGGKYSIKMQTQDGLSSVNYGVYKEIDSPRRLAFTWATNKSFDSMVILDFEPTGSGTRITLTHDMLPNEIYYYMHLWGWQRCFENLSRLVHTMTHERRAFA
jgi:uncharacterized protein YndB with AHSA1/START domain